MGQEIQHYPSRSMFHFICLLQEWGYILGHYEWRSILCY